jgi:hypothetical protein
LSRAVYDSIVAETKFYNEQLSSGKWNGMMSMKPRDLPVFLPSDMPKIIIDKTDRWNVLPEGYDTAAYQNNAQKQLPVFTIGLDGRYFVDVFLCDSVNISWSAKPSAEWIVLSSSSGTLKPMQDKTMQRIYVSVDWANVQDVQNVKGVISFFAGGKTIDIAVEAERPAFSNYKGFVESNALISIAVGNSTSKNISKQGKWTAVESLGHTGNAMKAVVNGIIDTTSLKTNAATVSYDFWSVSTTLPAVTVYTLPTHPLNNTFSMRYGVSIDDGPVQIVDFKTIGRSEEWKQNVLRNIAIRTLQFPALKPGLHKLTIYAIDPGVVLDRIVINFGNEQKSYSVVPDTYK